MKQDVSPVARPLDAAAVALVLALCVSWGFNQVAVKLALPDIPPLIQAAFRSTFGTFLLLGWMRLRGVKLMEPDGTPEEARRLATAWARRWDKPRLYSLLPDLSA